MRPKPRQRHIIVVGIDFGTTFSGAAWAYSHDPDNIEVVTSWDSVLNVCWDVEKTLTEIFFDDQNLEEVRWGCGTPLDKEAIEWFKLLLLENKDVPAYVRECPYYESAVRAVQDCRQDIVTIVAQYLRCLWRHTLASIQRSLGTELLEKCDLQVVLTVPAIWPLYAQHRMRKAAKAAGIDGDRDNHRGQKTTIQIISEPEAAVLATLKDMSKQAVLESGDTVIICDAGGGTVVSSLRDMDLRQRSRILICQDLISYNVESRKPFIVSECVQGDGGLHGGIFLDAAFIELLRSKIGPNGWKFVDKESQVKLLQKDWEQGIKSQFDDQDWPWVVDVERTRIVGTGKVVDPIVLSREELHAVFHPIMTEIIDLVEKQISAVIQSTGREPKYLMLVGGLGRNKHLFSRLEKALAPRLTEVLQSRGSQPWTAVCRGAVVSGLTSQYLYSKLQVKVAARIAPQNMGIKVDSPWIAGQHDPRNRFWSMEELQWRTTNEMEWFLKKGQRTDNHRTVRHNYYRLYHEEPHCIVEEVFTCALDKPPQFHDETNVTRLCTITWNHRLDFESLPMFYNRNGDVYRKIAFSVEMTTEGGSVDFDVYFEGQRVGGESVEINYDQ